MKITKVLIISLAVLIGIIIGLTSDIIEGTIISEANIPSEPKVIGLALEETDNIEIMRSYLVACDAHMQKAHNMANEARQLGYDDSHMIIQIAKQEYESANNLKQKYNELIYEYEINQPKVSINYNPFEVTNLSIEDFNEILAGTALSGYGESYYLLEKDYGINGVFAISVAFHESGYGKYRANTNNFYGMKGNNGWMAFESPHSNIQYFGKLMNKNLYYGKSIINIGKVYCPNTYSSWANAVTGIMNECYNKI